MNQTPFVITKTSDGSDTLYSEEIMESYHSLNGAVQESMHVFINAGFSQINKSHIRIFEVGFGTGLNCALTWREAKRKNIHVEYETTEAYPIPEDIYRKLNYPEVLEDLGAEAFDLIHTASWGKWEVLEKEIFNLKKDNVDFIVQIIEGKYDLVYYDAFAPNKQAELWDEPLFNKLYDAMNPGGIIVTYCAMGEVRRKLQRSGFKTERLPGPPGKREMLRAVK